MKKHLIILAATSLLSVSSVSAAGMYARVGGGAYWKFDNTNTSDLTTTSNYTYPMIPNAYIEFGMNITDALKSGVEVTGSLDSVIIKEKASSTSSGSTTASSTETNLSELKKHFTICAKGTFDLNLSKDLVAFTGVKVGYANGQLGFSDEAIEKYMKTVSADMKALLKDRFKLFPITAGVTLGIGYKFTDNMQLDISYNGDSYIIQASDLVESSTLPEATVLQQVSATKLLTHKLSAGLTFRF
jgi:opacity protein-like surface antigen